MPRPPLATREIHGGQGTLPLPRTALSSPPALRDIYLVEEREQITGPSHPQTLPWWTKHQDGSSRAWVLGLWPSFLAFAF